MSYIRKLPSGKYQVQIRFKGLRPISKSFQKKKDAIAFSRKVEGDSILAQALGNPVTTQTTISILIDNFLKQYNKKDTNISSRLAWWKEQYGSISISEFSQIHVLEGIRALLTKGTRGKPLQPQTTNRFKANLSAVFNLAKDNGYELINPCRGIKGKPEGKGRQRVFAEKEKVALLTAAKNSDWDQFYLFVLMGFTCGARAGELQRLTWKDVNFINKQAFCHDTKNGDDKILHLTPSVLDELKKFRGIGSAKVFIGQLGGNHTYRKNWLKALKDAGIQQLDDRYNETLVFHSERHTFCTDLHKAGKDLKVIQSLAGHKSINTTLRYTHDDETVKACAVADVFGTLGINN